MLSGEVTAGIAVVHQPDITRNMLLENHDVTSGDRSHARGGSGTGETPPIRREIEFRNDAAKLVERRLASTERVRATRRAKADYPFVTGEHGRRLPKISDVMKGMIGAGFGLSGEGQ